MLDLLAFFRSITPPPGGLLSSKLSGDPGNSVCRVGEREYFLAGRVWFRFAVAAKEASLREVRVTAVATLGVDEKWLPRGFLGLPPVLLALILIPLAPLFWLLCPLWLPLRFAQNFVGCLQFSHSVKNRASSVISRTLPEGAWPHPDSMRATPLMAVWVSALVFSVVVLVLLCPCAAPVDEVAPSRVWVVGAELLLRLGVGSETTELLNLLNWPSEGLWMPSGAS